MQETTERPASRTIILLRVSRQSFCLRGVDPRISEDPPSHPRLARKHFSGPHGYERSRGPSGGTRRRYSAFPQLVKKLEALGCEESIVGLVLPTGYAFNHDGTCLYFAAAPIFLAQAVGIDMTLAQQLGLLGVLLVTSKGGAGVAGSAIVVLVSTLAATDAVPVAAVGIILGVHRLMSSAFVSVNVLGNALATIVIAGWEGAVDRARTISPLSYVCSEREGTVPSLRSQLEAAQRRLVRWEDWQRACRI